MVKTRISQAALLLTGIASLPSMAQDNRPNIILIMTDQQRGDAVGCMGNESVITPNIDRIAQDGTVFTNGYSSCPSSTPARAGLLTGLSPWHHGMLGYGQMAESYKYEMPQILRDAGYYTFGIGKMHWHPQRVKHGFHGTLLDESGRIEDKNFTSDYRQWLSIQAPGVDPDITGIGWNDNSAAQYKLPEQLHPTHWTGEMACQLIENYDDERPLFLKVSFARPHSPYDPPQRFFDMYDDREIPAPSIGEWCSRYSTPLDPEKTSKEIAFGNMGEEYAVNSKRHYYASITFIDEEIGRIVAKLKEKGIYDNSIVIFTSDHGDMMGDHYHWRKTYPYEGSAHIPFIVKWPEKMNFEKGNRIENPVELRDILPTFMEMAGCEQIAELDGKSLTALANGNSEGWRKFIDMEHTTCYSDDNYWCALTDGKIKYIWNFNNGTEQLFDLTKDPHELKNIAENRKYRKVLEKMREAMVSHLSERGEPYVKDGKLMIVEKPILYSPNFPKKQNR